MVTLEICPESTFDMNSLNFSAFWLGWNRVEIFHTSIPTSTRTIQNARLFRVEFTQFLRQTGSQEYQIGEGFCWIMTSFPRRSSTRPPGISMPPAAPANAA